MKPTSFAFITLFFCLMTFSVSAQVAPKNHKSSLGSSVNVVSNNVTKNAIINIEDALIKKSKDLQIVFLDTFGNEFARIDQVKTEQIILPLDRLQAGTYFIKITDGKKLVITKRVIVE